MFNKKLFFVKLFKIKDKKTEVKLIITFLA